MGLKQQLNDVEDIFGVAGKVYRKLFGNGHIVIPKYENEQMNLLPDGDLPLNKLRNYMNYYSSWMAYFQTQFHRWKFVEDFIDRTYKQSYNRKMQHKTGTVKEYEYKVNLELATTLQARLYAQNRKEYFDHMLKIATTQKELVSRQVSIKTVEFSGQH